MDTRLTSDKEQVGGRVIGYSVVRRGVESVASIEVLQLDEGPVPQQHVAVGNRDDHQGDEQGLHSVDEDSRQESEREAP